MRSSTWCGRRHHQRQHRTDRQSAGLGLSHRHRRVQPDITSVVNVCRRPRWCCHGDACAAGSRPPSWQRQGEVELLEINFGDDVNDIRGSVLVVTTPVPGARRVGHAARRRRPGRHPCMAAQVALIRREVPRAASPARRGDYSPVALSAPCQSPPSALMRNTEVRRRWPCSCAARRSLLRRLCWA